MGKQKVKLKGAERKWKNEHNLFWRPPELGGCGLVWGWAWVGGLGLGWYGAELGLI